MVLANRKIYLTGFMGSGKSTIGQLLAKRLNWEFLDSDAEVEKASGLSISEIFATQGEGEFRELERIFLSKIAASSQKIVALGGGSLTIELKSTISRALWISDLSPNKTSDAHPKTFDR